MRENFGDGKIKLKWLGQMGFLIMTQDTTVCVDYFASPIEGRLKKPPIPAYELKGIDVFLGTHDHIDHIDHDAWKIWSGTCPDAKFIFPKMHLETILNDGIKEDNAIGLNDGDSYKIGDVTIHAIAASHEFLDRDAKTGLYPCLQYIIEANGIRIHHAGDTVRYEGMLPKLKSFGDIDIMILPINGRDAKRYRMGYIGNMTYQEAVDLAGEAGPEVVIPGHFDMFAENSADPEEFADYLDAKYGRKVRCIIPKTLEDIVLPG